MAKIIILGAGLVGSVMAKDLAKAHEVCSVDLNQKALEPSVQMFLTKTPFKKSLKNMTL